MKIGFPQLIWLILLALGLGINLAKHGEKRTDKYNFWSSLIGAIISFWIVYAGGFFN